MSTLIILESLQKFLQEKVTPGITLQKPNDDNVDEYKLVNPVVHTGWIPPKGYLPEGMESAIPCLIVGMDEASDDGSDREINIRITAAVYSPGKHIPADGKAIDYIPDLKGYHDLLNLIDKTVAELSRNPVINTAGMVQRPIKYGMYQEQPYPYWYGWITFTLRKSPYPQVESYKNLL